MDAFSAPAKQELIETSGRSEHFRDLAAQPASVGIARDALRRFCANNGVPAEVAESARLTVSELATNGLKNSREGEHIRLQLTLIPGQLTVGVWDSSPDLPVEPRRCWNDLEAIDTAPADQTFGGWGLRLARASGAAFGTTPSPSGGKTVWVTFTFGDPA